MKQLLLGFVLGIVACISIGATLYHPYKGVRIDAKYDANYSNFRTVMENQDAIFQLIDAKCGERSEHGAETKHRRQ